MAGGGRRDSGWDPRSAPCPGIARKKQPASTKDYLFLIKRPLYMPSCIVLVVVELLETLPGALG